MSSRTVYSPSMELYEFIYTDCIYESAIATMSLHLTKKGAYKAMREFLETGYMQWYNERIIYGKNRAYGDKFETHGHWAVRPIEVKE